MKGLHRLPKPHRQEPIEAQDLGPQYVVTRTEWESWCSPDSKVDQQLENQFDILDQLRSTIEQNDLCIPTISLQEIRHYVRLSQSVKMSPTLALDWALTLRLLPWIKNHPKKVDSGLNMQELEHLGLLHFCEGLQQAGEKNG